jgi:hypothetical protein
VLVWVASYPRSGNTLALTVLRDVYGVERLGSALNRDRLGLEVLPPDLPPGSARSGPFRLPDELAGLANSELLEATRDRPETFFIKTHRLRESVDPAPAVYIVRDGRDALVSYAHYVAERDVPRYRGLSFEDRLTLLVADNRRHPYGKWSQNVAAWRSRSAPTTLVRFEELIVEPVRVVTRACESLGLELPDATGDLAPFEALRERLPAVFRRGVVGGWADEMPPHVQELFWQMHGSEMDALGYSRD